MRELSGLITLTLCLTSIGLGQSPSSLLKKVRQIKLLESTRVEVKQVLFEFKTKDDNNHFQVFSNDDVEITVSYSTGVCSQDPDDDDESETWKVEEWKVTRIEMAPAEQTKIEDLGFTLSKFTKEQRYVDFPGLFVFHDKLAGVAFETWNDEVERIRLFPARGASQKLCPNNSTVKDFYLRKSWFAEKLEERINVHGNLAANVEDLQLSTYEISATAKRTVSVLTLASDPENDVLTYNYTVTGGQIRGRGAKVVWDLTGVSRGTYTIAVGVDDGCGICGKTITRKILVR